MSDFLMKPKVDFAFKEIMADSMTRVGFLSAILKLDPKDIKETHLINTNLRDCLISFHFLPNVL